MSIFKIISCCIVRTYSKAGTSILFYKKQLIENSRLDFSKVKKQPFLNLKSYETFVIGNFNFQRSLINAATLFSNSNYFDIILSANYAIYLH